MSNIRFSKILEEIEENWYGCPKCGTELVVEELKDVLSLLSPLGKLSLLRCPRCDTCEIRQLKYEVG